MNLTELSMKYNNNIDLWGPQKLQPHGRRLILWPAVPIKFIFINTVVSGIM